MAFIQTVSKQYEAIELNMNPKINDSQNPKNT